MNQTPTEPTPPTPDEVRWASTIFNDRKYGRNPSEADLSRAATIMRGLRRRPRGNNPLEAARALAAIDAKVAEAQGINAAREGEPVPAPTPHDEHPAVRREDVDADVDAGQMTHYDEAAEAVAAVAATPIKPLTPTRPRSLTRLFREAGDQLLEDLQARQQDLLDERSLLQGQVDAINVRITVLNRRRDAIIQALGAVEEASDA